MVAGQPAAPTADGHGPLRSCAPNNNRIWTCNASSASIDCMAVLMIRQLDDPIKGRLRIQAAHHGRSMEQEAREILRAALMERGQPEKNLATSIRERLAAAGGVELTLPEREALREPPDFAA